MLVKVDTTVHDKVGSEYEIQGFPTLKWFVNGKPTDYSGGRTASEIVAWVNKKSGPPAIDVKDTAAIEKLSESNDVVVLGIFDDAESTEANEFLAVAKAMDLVFAISTNSDVASHFKATSPGVSSGSIGVN